MYLIKINKITEKLFKVSESYGWYHHLSKTLAVKLAEIFCSPYNTLRYFRHPLSSLTLPSPKANKISRYTPLYDSQSLSFSLLFFPFANIFLSRIIFVVYDTNNFRLFAYYTVFFSYSLNLYLFENGMLFKKQSFSIIRVDPSVQNR